VYFVIAVSAFYYPSVEDDTVDAGKDGSAGENENAPLTLAPTSVFSSVVGSATSAVVERVVQMLN